MNDFPHPADAPDSPACPDGEALLMRLLDGEASAADFDGHLADCPVCAPERALLVGFAGAVAAMAPAKPPVGLADRLTRALRDEARPRRLRFPVRAAFAAAAAAALVALGVALWPKATPVVVPAPDIRVHIEPPEPLQKSLDRASAAVTALTNDVASSAALPVSSDAIKALTPAVPEELPPTPLEPLREASGKVADGLAPVTGSAMRAVNLFLRDMPGRRAAVAKQG